jgi:Flp pilus assembly protein TadG
MRRRREGQALVELALVMPILVGIVVVLFQYGILFITYLSIIHMTRDVARWLAVHPGSTEASVVAYVNKDLPNSVIVPTSVVSSGSLPNGGLLVTLSPTCGIYNSTTKRCTTDGASSLSRPTGSLQQVTLTYDAQSRLFLPTVFRFAGLTVPMPGTVQTYQYSVMVEPD